MSHEPSTDTDAAYGKNALINGARLWNSLDELSQIGATENGGVCRLAYGEVDRQGREQFAAWCREAGLTLSSDAIGNVFARREGEDPDAPAIVIGSHLDSQPTGGRYDGAYGVMCALEVIRSLNDHGMRTRAPIEIVSWANEEGTRFQPALMGSSVFTGRMALADALQAQDEEGVSVGSEIAADSFYRAMPAWTERPIGAYLEAHIEQGPVLEAAALPLGIVAGVQAIRWYEILIEGQEAHAGPTPMSLRHDAMMAASEMTSAIEEIALAHPPHGRGTVGTIKLHPSSRNVIPGRVFMTGDLRHPEDAVIAEMEAQLRAKAIAVAERRGLTITVELFWKADATPFDARIQDIFRTAARQAEIPFQDVVSGAGHDAQCMAKIVPTGMVFIPCLDGISHNEAESITPEHAEIGCRVLYEAVLELAGAQ